MVRTISTNSIIALLLLVTVYFGCLRHSDTPVSPVTDNNMQTVQDEVVHETWGYWQCSLDTVNGQINAIPDRTADLHINAAKPLAMNAGLVVYIDNDYSDPESGYYELIFELTHPYADYPNLSGFDVRGILITTANESAGGFNVPGSLDPVVLNADGYTRWWNPIDFSMPVLLGYYPFNFEFDHDLDTPLIAQLNPYRMFADCLNYNSPGSEVLDYATDSPVGRAVFKAGQTNQALYQVQFPDTAYGSVMYFNFAVDASWAIPANVPPQSIPGDFPIQANSNEAFLLSATETSNSLWHESDGGTGGGELGISITTWDWQGLLNSYTGQTGDIELFSPYCDFGGSTTPAVNNNGNGSVTLTATISGTPSQSGTIPVWVGVTAPGTSYKQNAKPAPQETVTAYTLINIDVEDQTGDPDPDPDPDPTFNFYLHCHIVRDSGGGSPAITPQLVQNYADWANEFWGIYAGISFSIDAITYIDNTAWLALNDSEGEAIFDAFGTNDGSVNVFYVDTLPDMPGAAAYAMMYCQYQHQTHAGTFVVMSDWGDGATLAHELGHAVGLLEDMYLLDTHTCEQLTSYCTYGTDIFCDPADAATGNLMYWPNGTQISDYWVSNTDIAMATTSVDSQAESLLRLSTDYPSAFFAP